METRVYIDVLLVLNYAVNLLLLQCTAKCTGRRIRRRRMVVAALFGAASSLSIFLPALGMPLQILLRIGVAAMIIRLAFPYHSLGTFAQQLFVFFAVSFFFSGIMLAVQLVFAPRGMAYSNGVVYFDLSSVTLVLTTVLAYAALSLGHRLARKGRLQTEIYTVEIGLNGKSVQVQGMVDTGNCLYEPFSGTPVMVCPLEEVAPLLPAECIAELLNGQYLQPGYQCNGPPFRLIPYRAVAGSGMLPAFSPDHLEVWGQSGHFRVERAYVAVASEPIGDGGYTAILHPDLVGMPISS